MGGIFICYRRKDSGYIAGRMQRDLAERFGADQVFLDGTGIKAGADFHERLGAQVNSCDALVAVIGDDWLTASQNGKRRLDDPKDWVRQEIGSALAREILVVPVLVEDAQPPTAADLPPALRGLTKRNCLELRAVDWDDGMRKLSEALEDVVRPLAKRPPPPPPDPPPPVQARVAAVPSEPSPPEPSRPLPFRPQFSPYGQPASEPPTSPTTSSSPSGWSMPVAPTRPYAGPSEEPAPGVPGWVKAVVPVVLLAVVIVVAAVALGGGDSPGPDVNVGTSPTTVATGPADSTVTTAAPLPPDPTPETRTIEGPWTGTSGNLSLIVEKVEVGSTIRLFLLVRNRLRTSVTLPTFGYFSAVDNTGKSYSVVAEDWARTFAPGDTRGTIDLGGPAASGASTLKIGFTTVFSSDFSVDDIYVQRVRLA
ncbi:MAG TPA: toll/interleukin-1 receptor domain-containing protein [Acidimicrobiales bacterium]